MKVCLKEATMRLDDVCNQIMNIIEDKYHIDSAEKESVHSFLILSLRFLALQGNESKSTAADVVLLLHTLLDCGYDYHFEETAFDIIIKETAEEDTDFCVLYEKLRPRISKFPYDIEKMLMTAFETVYLSGI